jgi:hypothetical protein
LERHHAKTRADIEDNGIFRQRQMLITGDVFLKLAEKKNRQIDAFRQVNFVRYSLSGNNALVSAKYEVHKTIQ